MKTALLATVVALSAALAAAAAGAPRASLPPSTGPDLSALSARESAVLARLEAFPKLGSRASLSRWETALRAAESAQTRAEAALNRDFATTPKPAVTPSLAQVGSTLDFDDTSGNPYSVQLVRMIDPARGSDQLTTPIRGNRFVAALFKITNTGRRRITDDANADASITGANAQNFLSDPDSVAECTNFESGVYQLAPKMSQTGCVVFQLPSALKVSTVEWSPGGRYIPGFQAWSLS